MFQEIKAMLPISGDDYDAEIILQIKAAALDLTTSAEIVMPGVVAITRTQAQGGTWTITDNSTITDELVLTAIGIWCQMRIGNPPNYDNLLKAYESLKGQMRISKNYTTWGGADDADDDQL